MPSPSVDDSKPHSASRWRRLALSPWLPAGLAVLCFANSLRNDFAYDDRALILDNPRIVSVANVHAIWLSDWWKLVENEAEANPQRDRLYRPLTLFSFALNYAVDGYHPAGYHLVNILLHALVCVLVWHFVRRLTGDAAVASLATVLFAVHPVHVEAVANVVGRAEVLVAGFMLGGLLLLAPSGRPPGARRALLAAGLFFLALLSKESGICYPAVALLTLYWTQREHRPGGRWWAMQVLVLLIPLVVYFPLRYVALDHHLTRTEFVAALMNPIATAAGLGRVIAPFTVLGHYVRLLLVPARLSCDYGMAILDPRQGVTAMTLLGMAGAGALAVGLFGLTRRTAGGRLVGLLTAMFLVSYALISNAVLLIGVDLAERFMYWPSVPLLMLLAVGVVELGRRYCAPGRPLAASGRRLRILGVLLVAALGVRSLVRNTDWASNGALFQTDVRTYPQGAHLNRGCALELLRYWEHASPSGPSREAFEAARRYLDRALAIHPGYVEALALRGEVRAQLGDIDGALLDVEAATQLNPNDRVARKTFARLMYGENPDERLRESRAAVAAHPEDAAAHLDLGRALLECGGRATEAEQQLEVAARLAPDSAEPLRELGKALALEHKHDQAVAVLERGVALAPQDWQIHANLASLLGAQRPAEALLHAERAYELKPGEPRNSINLAEAYAVNGQTANAIAWYQKVEQQLDQDDPLREVVAQRLEFLRSRR